MSNYYNAFGFIILSDIKLVQVPEIKACDLQADIVIKLAELTTEDVDTEYDYYGIDKSTFCVDDIGLFRITQGSLIEVRPFCKNTDKLSIFLMGSCMGAIFHQRMELILHGSVITQNGKTILFTGESGAGKSTIASEFCTHGWKILTDDVALIKHPQAEPLVQPSYPSQKLWEDSCERFYNDESRIHAVYERENANKYGVSVPELFAEEGAVLTDIVCLYKSTKNTAVENVPLLEGIKLIMDNTYRWYMIPRCNLEKQFQQCVDLAANINIYAIGRDINCPDSRVLYDTLVTYLSNNNQE